MYLIQPTRHLSSFWQKKDYTHFHCLDKFAASQPLGYESCLETPQRYLYAKKLLKTKRAPWRWRYWGAMMACITLNKHKTQDMEYVRISFFQVLEDRYPLQSKFALLCISYSRHDTFRLSGRRKIILTSSHFHCLDKFAASQPLGYESCLETPKRYLYTKKLLKTKRAPWRWRYWGAMMAKWQYCLYMCRLYESAFSKMLTHLHRMIVCLKFFEEHQIFRNTPHVKRIGYSTMAMFYT